MHRTWPLAALTAATLIFAQAPAHGQLEGAAGGAGGAAGGAGGLAGGLAGGGAAGAAGAAGGAAGTPVTDASAKVDNFNMWTEMKRILVEAGLMETLLQDSVRAIGDPEFRKNYFKKAGLGIAGVYGLKQHHVDIVQGIREGDWEKVALGALEAGLVPGISDTGKDYRNCKKAAAAKNPLTVIPKGATKEQKKALKAKRKQESKAIEDSCTKDIKEKKDIERTCGYLTADYFKPPPLTDEETRLYSRMTQVEKAKFNHDRLTAAENKQAEATGKCHKRVKDRNKRQAEHADQRCKDKAFVERSDTEQTLYEALDPAKQQEEDRLRALAQNRAYKACGAAHIANQRNRMISQSRQANRRAAEGLIRVGRAIDEGNYDKIRPEDLISGMSTLGIRKPENEEAEIAAARILKKIVQKEGDVDREEYERFLMEVERAGHGRPDTMRRELETWARQWSKKKLQQARNKFRKTNKDVEKETEQKNIAAAAQGDYPPKTQTAETVETALPAAEGKDLSDPAVARQVAEKDLFLPADSSAAENSAEAAEIAERRSRLAQTAALDGWQAGLASQESIEESAKQNEQLSSAMQGANSLREDVAVLTQAIMVGNKQQSEQSHLMGQSIMLQSMESIQNSPVRLTEEEKESMRQPQGGDS